MKHKMIALVVLAVCLPLSVFAQQGQPKGSDDNQGINRMAKDLGLSDDQKTRVQTIFSEEKQTVEAIFKEQGDKLKTVQQQTHDSLQQVLTPEQLSKFEKKIQQQGKRKKH